MSNPEVKPYYENEFQRLYQGDVRELLPALSEASVDMVITSPPYYGLRKYDGEPVIWDGDKGCKHEWITKERLMHNGRGDAQKGGKFSTQPPMPDMPIQENFCRLCDAWRGQLGLEPTPELYIRHLCDIFDLTKRVLKKTGVMFVNLDDSYAESGKASGVPAKSLIGIPERFVLEMMNRGWIRRNTIIWHKNNPMPESVKDRFTSDFEYLYMFSQQQHYYFEQQFEEYSPTVRWDGDTYKGAIKGDGAIESGGLDRERSCFPNPQGRNKRCVWTINTKPYKEAHFATFPPELVKTPILAGCPKDGTVMDIFVGSGTTMQVALSLGRKSIGIDTSMKYCELTKKRPAQLGNGI